MTTLDRVRGCIRKISLKLGVERCGIDIAGDIVEEGILERELSSVRLGRIVENVVSAIRPERFGLSVILVLDRRVCYKDRRCVEK